MSPSRNAIATACVVFFAPSFCWARATAERWSYYASLAWDRANRKALDG